MAQQQGKKRKALRGVASPSGLRPGPRRSKTGCRRGALGLATREPMHVRAEEARRARGSSSSCTGRQRRRFRRSTTTWDGGSAWGGEREVRSAIGELAAGAPGRDLANNDDNAELRRWLNMAAAGLRGRKTEGVRQRDKEGKGDLARQRICLGAGLSWRRCSSAATLRRRWQGGSDEGEWEVGALLAGTAPLGGGAFGRRRWSAWAPMGFPGPEAGPGGLGGGGRLAGTRGAPGLEEGAVRWRRG